MLRPLEGRADRAAIPPPRRWARDARRREAAIAVPAVLLGRRSPRFLLLLGLGTWQVERLTGRRRSSPQRKAALEAAPVAPPETLDDARALEFHPRPRHRAASSTTRNARSRAIAKRRRSRISTSSRRFLLDERRHPAGRSRLRAGAAARSPRQPRRRADRRARPRSTGIAAPADRARPLVRARQRSGARIPGSGSTSPPWPRRGGLERRAALLSRRRRHAQSRAAIPSAAQTETDLPNNHLQYAITWYALAAALVGVYILFVRRRRSRRPRREQHSLSRARSPLPPPRRAAGGAAMLHWDTATMMPEGGADARAEQHRDAATSSATSC